MHIAKTKTVDIKQFVACLTALKRIICFGFSYVFSYLGPMVSVEGVWGQPGQGGPQHRVGKGGPPAGISALYSCAANFVHFTELL